MPQATFVVKIMCTQNSTWQGTIDWLQGKETKSQHFRSALELIRMIDSTLPKDDVSSD